MRYRQIHLDFHTSERIPGIGSRFDAERLRRHVRGGERRFGHRLRQVPPRLVLSPDQGRQAASAPRFRPAARADRRAARGRDQRTDLSLRRLGRACGARASGLARRLAGRRACPPARRAARAGWAFLDFNSPYLDYLCRAGRRGDATSSPTATASSSTSASRSSSSTWAQTKMEAQGLDWTDRRTGEVHRADPDRDSSSASATPSRKHDPKMPLFFNFGHVRRGRRDILTIFTHLEIESLPTAFWGYEHFPVSARYVDPLGIPFLGMTGKFHHLLGRGRRLQEAGGAALRMRRDARAGRQVLDRRPSSSDRPHRPHDLWASIAPAYAHVKASASPGPKARPTAPRSGAALEAATRPRSSAFPATMSMPTKARSGCCSKASSPSTFSTSKRLSPYRLLILPDAIPVGAELKPKIEAYVDAGRPGAAHRPERHRPGERLRLRRRRRVAGRLALSRAATTCCRSRPLRAGFVDDPLFMYAVAERIRLRTGSLARRHLRSLFRPHAAALLRPRQRRQPARSVRLRPRVARMAAITYFAHPLFTPTSARRGRDAGDRRKADRLGAGARAMMTRRRCRARAVPRSAARPRRSATCSSAPRRPGAARPSAATSPADPGPDPTQPRGGHPCCVGG